MRLTNRVSPASARVARGVPAARSGAPLADAVTHKLVGCIPQLGCWMSWTAANRAERQISPCDRPAICAQTATAHLQAGHSSKLDMHIISRQGRSLPPLFTQTRSVHQNAESPLRVSALNRAPTPQGDPDFHRCPISNDDPDNIPDVKSPRGRDGPPLHCATTFLLLFSPIVFRARVLLKNA